MLTNPTWRRFFDSAGEFYDHYTGEIFDRNATIAGIRAKLMQMQEFGGNASPRSRLMRKSSARKYSTKPGETKCGRELWHESTQMECLHQSTTQARHQRVHWRRAGAADSSRSDGVTLGHRNRFVSRPRQIRPAVRDEGARTGHAGTEQAVNAEAQAGGPVPL